MNKYQTILAFLKEQSIEAGKIMLNYKKKGFKIFTKPDDSKVTEADLAISQMIQHKIAANYPEIILYSEESEEKPFNKNSAYFIIDELDGTHYYIEGSPWYCHLAAYYEAGKGIMAGLIYYPEKDILLTAIRGEGVNYHKNGSIKNIRSIPLKPFKAMIFHHSERYKGRKYYDLLKSKGFPHKQVLPISTERHIAMIEGRMDAMINLKPYVAPWDWAAPQIILEETGFSYSYLDGEDLIFGQERGQDNRGYMICPIAYKSKMVKTFKDVY